MGFELVALRSGATSLRCLDHNETFHPVTGPLAEANILHVDQQRLRERAALTAPGGRFVVWDVGLGAAANATAVITALAGSVAQVELHSFDITRAPLHFALENAEALSYPLLYRDAIEQLLATGIAQPSPNISWFFHEGDFKEKVGEGRPAPAAVIYDPYSPKGNVDMWTLDHFTRLRSRLDSQIPSLLTNYTRSTAVRVTLLLAGFYVGVGCLIGDKAETTVASNTLDLIERPLDREWLVKAWVSRNGAPMRGMSYQTELITPEDFAVLEKHPQFA